MELSNEQKEQIYLEEKRKRESASFSATPYIMSTVIAIGIVGLFAFVKTLHETGPNLDKLRKAYSGLPPEDIED